MRSIVIVGASLAGLSAARALRSQGFDGALTIVGAERHRPYDRPPLSKGFLAGAVDRAALDLEDPDEALDARWLLGVSAVALDARGPRLDLSDGSRLEPDGVVLATGASPRRLPGSAPLAGVHVLRTVDDAAALRTDLASGGRLVVIGAGFIGSEVASTARSLGLDVTVVEVAPTPLAGPLGVVMGTAVAALHSGHGTRLVCGVGVRGLTGTERVTGVELADGSRIGADVVVVGVGAAPAVDWLQGSAVALDRGPGGGVHCDAAGASSVPHVVAVGDCAAWHEPLLGRPHRVEHWTAALERPAIAVATLLGRGGAGNAGQPAVSVARKAPYFWSDQYGVRIQFAGITAPGDEVDVEAGDLATGSFLAVYRRRGEAVAVLGVDQVRLFTRWRRQLATAVAG